MTITRLKQQLPTGLDVHLDNTPNLRMTISGLLDGRAVDTNVVQRSALVREMMRFIRHVCILPPFLRDFVDSARLLRLINTESRRTRDRELFWTC